MDVSRTNNVTRRLSSLRRTLNLNGTSKHSHAFDSAREQHENKTMFQGFEWYTHPSAMVSHWKRLMTALPYLQAIGIDTIWLPPGCKASSPNGNGYDVYDLYDLGEFNQKGSQVTKWGRKEELVELCQTAKRLGIGVIWDAVLNHKAAADGKDRCQAVKVNEKDRRKEISRPHDVEVWTKFDFPARGAKYSPKQYSWRDFSGVDYDAATHTNAIYKFTGPTKPGWAIDVDTELGNYDYLMFANVDYSQPSVRQDVLNWGSWIANELGLSGFRLDAMKHYSQEFQKEFVKHMDGQFGRDFFIVGEYWKWDSYVLSGIVGQFKGRISLFDVQLVYNFSDYSKEKRTDLRRIFNGALVQLHPQRAVTFVQNHDTQPLQSLAAPIQFWFLPHAYALILLRSAGTPCVFYGDLFGTNAPPPYTQAPAMGGRLARLVAARKHYAYGKQRDYFDQEDCIGWTRSGAQGKNGGVGLAVLVNTSWEYKSKKMLVGTACKGEKWMDLLGWSWGSVEVDEFGEGKFSVGPRSVGVWVKDGAKGMDKIEKLVMDRIPEENGRW